MTQAEARTLWRELVNEKDTTVPTDATIDLYLQCGLQALNRRTEYAVTDNATGIVLVAGTQEYDLPLGFVKLVWMEWHGKEIKKSSIEEWMRREIPWRYEPAGEPDEYAILGLKLILRPTPSAEAVAATSATRLRYVSSPLDFTLYGFDGLGDQSVRLVIEYAVALWRAAHPDTDTAPATAETFIQIFEADAALVAREYAERGLKK